jgi:outer membrane protein OmpA-like peptidoglycan-associated protein
VEPTLIFFDSGKPVLSQDAIATLEGVLRTASPRANWLLVGFADRSGAAQANRRIAQARADAVRSYVVAHGTPAELITVQAQGENAPLIATADGVREPQNRRVEIVLRP